MAISEWSSAPPTSSSTARAGSAPSRFATTQPAEPAPPITYLCRLLRNETLCSICSRLALDWLSDAAQLAQPPRLLRLLQRALLTVFIDRVFGAPHFPARVTPRDREHRMPTHRAAADAQL